MQNNRVLDKLNISRKAHAWLEVLLGGALVLMLTFTSPQRLGPVGVTVFFSVLLFFSLNTIQMYYIATDKSVTFWLKVVYATLPVALLALSSLRQLTITDLILSIGLVVIITMYHNRQMLRG